MSLSSLGLILVSSACRLSITGHSMGGHGALSIALKNSKMFRSVSAFAPICNPVNCPWGIKAFSGIFFLFCQ